MKKAGKNDTAISRTRRNLDRLQVNNVFFQSIRKQVTEQTTNTKFGEEQLSAERNST
jgi:hypothetical protein